MPRFIQTLLASAALWLLARVLIVIVFTSSGLAKLLDFQQGVQEMTQAGLEPAVFFNVLTAVTLLLGSVLVLADRALWLGAGMLAVFLAATILVVHTFWNMEQPQAMLSMYFALEHLSLIGGLMGLAIASHLRRQLLAMRGGLQA
ncbi:DoxX family protein [Alcaligenes sp. WGS1538]|uniref:DoxX family protein n=1 Tax=Alcaligenes sp. WGS1538 TaxID=3366811 RepID=UPI00372D0AC3